MTPSAGDTSHEIEGAGGVSKIIPGFLYGRLCMDIIKNEVLSGDDFMIDFT